ncbi:MAG: hypothetical protein ABIP68_00265 [Ferruginibacter sp.]
MKNLYFISIFYLLLTSCNQGASKSEKDYIKNLEEKNRVLENELQDEKNKPPVIIETPAEKIYIPQEVPVERNIPKDYFTIGSTEDEVLEVMGDPTSIMDSKYSDRKTYIYEYSSISFTSGRVSEYSNIGKNLKVKVRRK